LTYQPKYVRVSKIRELLVEGDTKIRVSGEAKDKINKYLDDAIEAAVKVLIEKLPRKSKGGNKGELKRITIKPEDFE